MRVLVATGWTQGARETDFDWCVEGELVWVGFPVCERDANNPFGGCGCGRSFSGANSRKATTTARVSDLDMTRDDYVEALRASLDAGGYNPLAASDLADHMLELASDFPEHSVLERLLDYVICRAEVTV
ncbi:hypothetical protein GCM10007304_13230 [Rhodococcoides trifolii]|uniref:DUF7715 domain-containing protein n=1 Tax=Rhodococcoides trifolii TaxID=908250 RepID=A0A917FTL4_9NOCA|nr:hypothetical protein [Rhodococcus trifolii]GGG00654.1 hypothetical protein GCM10007304_13230 [Rhodococcus trifolii]